MAGLPALRRKGRRPSPDQCPAACRQHAATVFRFEPDDERPVAQRGGGGAVCLASAPRRIRGLGGRKKRRALRLFLDVDVVALRPSCRATFRRPLSCRARGVCPLPDVQTDGRDPAVCAAAAGLLAAEAICDLRFAICDFQKAVGGKSSIFRLVCRWLRADAARAANRDGLHRRAAGFRAHRQRARSLTIITWPRCLSRGIWPFIIPTNFIRRPGSSRAPPSCWDW